MRNRFRPQRISVVLFSTAALCVLVLIIATPFSAGQIWRPVELQAADLSAQNAAPGEAPRLASSLAAIQQGAFPQAADSPPSKSDTDSNGDPINKLIGSASWQQWLNLEPHLKAKVDPRLIAELTGKILPVHLGGLAESHLIPPSDRLALDHTRFVVTMADQLDLNAALAQRVYASSVQQRNAALAALNLHAQTAQAALSASLNDRMNSQDVLGYHAFFIVNAMAVEGNLDTIIALAKRADVSRVQANYPLVPLWNPAPWQESEAASRLSTEASTQVASTQIASTQAASALPQSTAPVAGPEQSNSPDAPGETDELAPANWNIDLVDADQVWRRLGVRGEGAVVAGFDTGVEFNHPSLNSNYRGNQGNDQYDHNYSWFAPDSKLYPDGNLGASISNQPSDCNFYSTHGTHTMGTMVGRSVPASTITDSFGGSSGGTDIGMAPDARWIAVPGICNGTMPGDLGDDIGALKAFQWLLCPTDLTGDLSTADCSKAPDVVNNSWGSANPVNDILHPAIESLRAAGIAPVFASGNPYAGKGSIGTPGNSPAAITVGATDIDDQIADFSGRGPSFYPGEYKPELSAPGVEVRSSVSSNFYDSYSGTSMAAPHVAGLVALMVSADLQDGTRDFDIDELERFMTYTAVDLGPEGHDNDYGFGRIDAFSAVSWVKSAGDLRGTITDGTTGQPLAYAEVTGKLNSRTFFAQSGSTGLYSITAPAGIYDIEVQAWGYEPKRFSGQNVFPSSLSFADFQLEPEVLTTLNGSLTTGDEWSDLTTSPTGPPPPTSGSPIANAQISVAGHPQVTTVTDATGAFSLPLPAGNHELRIQAASHRSITATVDVSTTAEAPQPLALTLDSAPRLLVVDADAAGGWFTGWPVYPVIEYMLNSAGYPTDLWRIQHLDVVDISRTVDGFEKRGIPSLETLQQYDVILWIHSGCADIYCFAGGTPKNVGAEELLTDYLDGGGRLIISGQNVSAWAGSDSELMRYLGAQHVDGYGGAEGETLEGSDIFEELSLEITNAALYGHQNGLLYLSPDAVQPRQDESIAVPILTYQDGHSGALAVSPCAEDYRALFYSVGLENLGPRDGNAAFEAVKAMDLGIQWLAQAKTDYAISATANQLEQSQTPGDTLWYELSVANSGLQPLTIRFNLSGAEWKTDIYAGMMDAVADGALPIPVGETYLLEPCRSLQFSINVALPNDVPNGARDVATIEILTDAPIDDSTGEPSTPPSLQFPTGLIETVELTSVAFAAWENQAAMPTPRYRLAVESLPSDLHVYAIGGWNSDTFEVTSLNERYNACTGKWSTLAPAPVPLSAAGSAIMDGKIYLSGGFDAGVGSFEASARDNVLIYDPTSNTWDSGISLPRPMYGHAMAAHQGSLYVFGGQNNQNEFDSVYILRPGAESWEELDPLPGGKRAYANAAVLNNRIYLIGGWPAIDVVEVYDPADGSWSEAAKLNFGRQSPGVEVGPDGYIYVAAGGNGWNGIQEVERYDPALDDWEIISSLRASSRTGGGLAFASGRLHTIGGVFNSFTNEGLQLQSAFCQSNKLSKTPVAQPDGSLVYQVVIEGDSAPISNIQVIDTIPVSTTFAGFDDNPIGAVYDETVQQIRWTGEMAAGAAGLSYTYTVALNPGAWPSGSEVTSTTRFEGQLPLGGVDAISSAGLSANNTITPTTLVITQTTRNRVFVGDFMPSSLSSSAANVIEGERLTYTVDLKSSNAAGGLVTVWGTLPEGMSLVPNSIRWSASEENGIGAEPEAPPTIEIGQAAYRLSGLVGNDNGAFVNSSDNFVWNDSQGESSFDGIGTSAEYDWVEIADSGTQILSGDDQYLCSQPIGFAFPFYGQRYENFCVSTNGFISFDTEGYSNLLNECPMPSSFGNRSIVAALWDDLVTEAIYKQTVGEAPNRSLIVEFVDALPYSSFSDKPAKFEIILHEDGRIQMQYHSLFDGLGVSSTTGVSNQDNTTGLTYACNTADSLAEESAVWFTPSGGSVGSASAAVSYSIVIEKGLPVNATISNTVYISDSVNIYTRTLETELNPVGITGSAAVAGGAQIDIGGEIRYQFTIENSGRLTASNVSLIFPLADGTTYIANSLSCSSGTCNTTNQSIEWSGQVIGRGRVDIQFSAELTEQVPHNTPIVGVGTIDDGLGNQIKSTTYAYSRSSDLTRSLISTEGQFVELGNLALLEFIIRNTGGVQTEARATIALPAELTMLTESLICGTGQCSAAANPAEGGTVTWQGTAPPRSAIPIRLLVQVPDDGVYGQTYEYSMTVTDLNRQELTELAGQITAARLIFYPVGFAPIAPKHIYVPIVSVP